MFECHRVRLLRTAVLSAVAVAALPASAGAATLTVDKPCYREGANAVASGTGFTPNTQVRFTLDGVEFTDEGNVPSADAAGNLNAGFGIGSPPGKQKTYTLGASDGTNSGETTFTATDLDVTVKPKRGNPGKRKRVRARGFDQGALLRYHVRGPREAEREDRQGQGPVREDQQAGQDLQGHLPDRRLHRPVRPAQAVLGDLEPARGVSGHDLPGRAAQRGRCGVQRRGDLDPARLDLHVRVSRPQVLGERLAHPPALLGRGHPVAAQQLLLALQR